MSFSRLKSMWDYSEQLQTTSASLVSHCPPYPANQVVRSSWLCSRRSTSKLHHLKLSIFVRLVFLPSDLPMKKERTGYIIKNFRACLELCEFGGQMMLFRPLSHWDSHLPPCWASLMGQKACRNLSLFFRWAMPLSVFYFCHAWLVESPTSQPGTWTWFSSENQNPPPTIRNYSELWYRPSLNSLCADLCHFLNWSSDQRGAHSLANWITCLPHPPTSNQPRICQLLPQSHGLCTRNGAFHIIRMMK